MKLGSKGYSRVLIPNLTIVFVDSFLKCFFFGIFGQGTSKCLILNETRYKVVFKGFDFKFDNCFCKFLIIPFGANLAPKLQTSLFKIKFSTMEYSRGVISNSTNLVLNYVPKITFSVNVVPKIENPLSWVKVSKERYYLILRTFYVTFVTLYSYSSYLSFVLVTSSINLPFALI